MVRDASNSVSFNNFINSIPEKDKQRYLFNLEFAIALKSRREELGLTQEALAQKSGVNRMTINKIEKLNRAASLDLIFKLLDCLGLKICFVNRGDSGA